MSTDPLINRNNFDGIWLESYTFKKSYTKFNAIPIKEKNGKRKIIKNALVEAIIDHHITPEEIESAKLFKKMGYPKVADLCNLPKNHNVKIGNFGEVISSEHLRQRYNFKIPVFKLRYSANPDVPMPGEDIIAFEVSNNEIVSLCIGEAKTLGSYRSDKVKEAHERLEYTYSAHPTALALIYRILLPENKNFAKEVHKVMALLGLEGFPRTNWIFLITGNCPRDPFDPIQQLDNIVENLNVINIHLPNLSLFINEIFELCEIEVGHV